MNQTDYIITEETTINEGLTTGTITHAAMLFTRSYIYIVPYGSQKVLGNKYTTTEYTNTEGFLTYIHENLDNFSDLEFHKKITDYLPKDRVIHISSLNKFKINTGWLTAGIKFKELNGSLKVVSIKPKEILVKLKEFYKL
jgi:hypothetical protein